jgi:hypothetical protein
MGEIGSVERMPSFSAVRETVETVEGKVLCRLETKSGTAVRQCVA